MVALFSLGSLVGALLGGPLSDWVGRRAALVTGALLVASGTIIQSAAIALWQVQMLRIDCSYTYFLQDATGWEDLDWSWKWVSTENNNVGYASYPTHVLNKRIIQS